MFRRSLVVVVVVVMLMGVLAGCNLPGTGVVGSGTLESRTFDFSDFSEVEGQFSFNIKLNQGDTFAVEVTADDNVWEVLDVRQEGQRVILGLNESGGYNNVTLEATITMPALEELHLSGASFATLSGFAASAPFLAEVSGASRLEGAMDAGVTSITLSGASRAVLAGSGESLVLDASGASQADLGEFAVGDADVNVSGASRATVAPSGTLNVDASGASNVSYVGSPTLGSVETSGASTVSRQ